MARAKGDELIGLDLGSSAIKVVEMSQTREGYFLEKFALAPLPPDAIVEGEIADRPAVAEAIKGLFGQLGIKTREVASCIPSKSVIIKKINLPPMTEFELEEQIPYEAEQHVPFNIDEVYLDYQPLETASLERDQMEVLLVAAKRDFVEKHQEVLREAGLKPIVVDVDVFALGNIYEVNYPPSDEVIALVDLGASMIKVNILTSGVTAFNRDVPLGGKALTEEIQQHWGLSFEDAEGVKKGQELSGINPAEVENLIYNHAQALVGELGNSFEFFLATPYGRAVNRIYLSGGVAKAPGLLQVISEQTGLAAELLNPFARVGWDRKKYTEEYMADIAPLIAVGAGLALRRSKER